MSNGWWHPATTVRAGDVVVILEAMKMEHRCAEWDGFHVTELLFAQGDTVDVHDSLLISERIIDIRRGLGC